jgi:uncharacterized Zn finger protein
MSWGYEWRPYVPVAVRKARAASKAAKLAKKENRTLCPVQLEGRKIAHTFWGISWCENLERYSDFANRLPRGRSYVRNGSVIDLQIETGTIKALVAGSELYKVLVSIKTLPKTAWACVKKDCAQGIDSLIDLLKGRFDQGVMKRLTQPESGLFPQPREIEMSCSCPDWAVLCKHVAAVLYAIGARLDAQPELLFTLRGVDHLELIHEAVTADNLERSLGADTADALAPTNLGEIFGIDIEGSQIAVPSDHNHSTVSLPEAGTVPRSMTRPATPTRRKEKKRAAKVAAPPAKPAARQRTKPKAAKRKASRHTFKSV